MNTDRKFLTVSELLSEIYEIREEIKYKQKNCKHDWEYTSDPSGNNDSLKQCKICKLIK